MQIDFSADGSPAAQWATEHCDSPSVDIVLGSLSLCVQQPMDVEARGTGALVWPPGSALATALASASLSSRFAPSALAGLRAVELGCGCSALPGVALALSGVDAVTLTDQHDMMEPLAINLASYGRADASAIVDKLTPLPLEWSDRAHLAELAAGDGYDLVLGADVDYAETLHPSLLDAVVAALAPSQCGETAALFASAARCERTLQLFLGRLSSLFTVCELSPSLEPLEIASSHGVSSSKTGGVRFFLATWTDAHTARQARARLAVGARPHGR